MLYGRSLLVVYAAAAAKSLQLCPTPLDPIDGSPPGSPIPGILQARTLEWVAISFSNAWKWKVKVKSLSRVWLFATPWTVAHQAPPSMGFSRQEDWSGVPLPSLTCNIAFAFNSLSTHNALRWAIHMVRSLISFRSQILSWVPASLPTPGSNIPQAHLHSPIFLPVCFFFSSLFTIIFILLIVWFLYYNVTGRRISSPTEFCLL